jgi:hypothetical protein
MKYAISERSCTGVDMYGVENPLFVGPAVRPPCLPRYRIVDKGSPEEDEHKRAYRESRAF